jgi:hypothetical protein
MDAKMKRSDPEALACTPHPLNLDGFNPMAEIAYECTAEQVVPGEAFHFSSVCGLAVTGVAQDHAVLV